MMRLFVGALGLAVVISAMAVVDVTQKHRHAVMQLEALDRERIELEADYGRFQLEEGALASHLRIEHTAVEQLSMHRPEQGDVRVVLR